jgi:hypothetical protein
VRFNPGFLSGGGFSSGHFEFGGFFFILVNSKADCQPFENVLPD